MSRVSLSFTLCSLVNVPFQMNCFSEEIISLLFMMKCLSFTSVAILTLLFSDHSYTKQIGIKQHVSSLRLRNASSNLALPIHHSHLMDAESGHKSCNKKATEIKTIRIKINNNDKTSLKKFKD